LGQFEDQLFKKECIEYIFENSLNVHFHGFKSGIDKEFYLDLSSVLILVSRNEGFPMVIPEAFSYGLVTIATRIAAIPEIIISNYNGLLTDLEDISGLVKSLIFLHSSPMEFNRISENALNSSKLYSFKAHCNKLESFYLKFIDE
jgi:glycosyltransferase involved in cell wall biosynthesis